MTGEELQRRRKGLEMTQPQLAEALGCDVMTISRWERGIHEVPPAITLAMDALGFRKYFETNQNWLRERLIATGHSHSKAQEIMRAQGWA